MNNFDFGTAINHLKDSKRVARSGWNGKDMWLRMVHNEAYDVECFVMYNKAEWDESLPIITQAPWIGMKTADDKFTPWLASQSDMLSDDWVLVEAD